MSCAPGQTLLAAGEPEPFELVEPSASQPLIFVCDHAANRVPSVLGSLGVAQRHLGHLRPAGIDQRHRSLYSSN